MILVFCYLLRRFSDNHNKLSKNQLTLISMIISACDSDAPYLQEINKRHTTKKTIYPAPPRKLWTPSPPWKQAPQHKLRKQWPPCHPENNGPQASPQKTSAPMHKPTKQAVPRPLPRKQVPPCTNPQNKRSPDLYQENHKTKDKVINFCFIHHLLTQVYFWVSIFFNILFHFMKF